MILYTKSRSGSQECEILSPLMSVEKWAQFKGTVCKLLRNQSKDYSAKLMEELEFKISEGTNSFGDEFSVLHISASVERYVELTELKTDHKAINAFKEIVAAFDELNMYVRFIVVNISQDSAELVPQPEPMITTESVERALKDSQQLIYTSGAASAVDRIHTALHGYLKAICIKYCIAVSEQASLTEVFKVFRLNYPSFKITGTGGEEVKKLFGSLATIIDCLNTLRNRASMAHPNDSILEEAEAILAINCARTILHYVDAKLK